MRLRKHIAAVAGALLLGSALALPTTAATAATPIDLAPKSFKTCEAMSGVGTVHEATPNKPQPVDENVNVYVGGDFTRTVGAELEGQLVVNGNATLGGSALYNMGWVGVGSGILPVSGQDIVRVGGDFTLEGTSRAEISSKATSGALLPGNVKAGGAIQTEAKISLGGGGTISQNLGRADALGETFAAWPNDGFALLSDFATRNHTGASGTYAFAAGGYLELTGTPGADRHLFTIPGDELTGQTLVLKLVDIDPTDITVVKVTGAAANMKIEDVYLGSTQLVMGDQRFGQISARTLWTFSDATSVTIGGGQVPGSVVVPTAGSVTTLTAAGGNGRYWVAGDLVHNRGGGEFHAFPFLGDEDATCGTPPSPLVVPPVVVAPVLPSVVQSVCDGGAPTAASVTLPADTADVVYSKAGTEAAGNTVVVTASAQGGSVFESSVSGWTVSLDRKTATRDVVLTVADCAVVPPIAVAPVAPTLNNNVCVAGEASAPTLIFDTTTGVTYEITSGTPTAGTTATVKATAANGYQLTSADGWVLAGDSLSATIEIEIPAAPECAPVTADPGIAQATCAAGAKLTLPTTVGIAYTASSANPAPGEKVTITATPESGYVLTAGDGWTLYSDGTATKQIVLTKPTCGEGAGVITGGSGTSGGGLAATGGEPAPFWVIGGAFAALIAGAVLLVVRRRVQTDA